MNIYRWDGIQTIFQDDSFGNMIETGHFNNSHNIRSSNYFYHGLSDDCYIPVLENLRRNFLAWSEWKGRV